MMPSSGIRPGIRELLSRELIFETSAEPRLEYVFKQAITRDVAYGGILVSRRRSLHAAVAQAIADLYAHDPDSYQAIMGHHWERAGDRDKAATAYRAGSRAAISRSALLEAERLLRAFLSTAEPSPSRVDGRIQLANWVLAPLGRVEESLTENRIALEEAESVGDGLGRVEALLGISVAHLMKGERGTALELCDRALAVALEIGNRRAEAQARGTYAQLLKATGKNAEAREQYRATLKILRRTEDDRAEATVLGNLANLEQDQGNLDKALRLYRRARKAHRKAGNRRGEAHVLGNMSNLLSLRERFDEASDLLLESVATLHEIGDRKFEATFRSFLASVRYRSGRFEEARGLLQEVVAAADTLGDARVKGLARLSQAAMKRVVDADFPAAADCLEEVGRIAAALSDRMLEGLRLGQQGRLDLAVHGATDALDPLQRIVAELGAGRESRLGQELAALERASVRPQALFRGELPEELPHGLGP